MERTMRTSVEIQEDLYRAFQQMGGVLSILVRDAMADFIGIKGASEDSLAVLELKRDRLHEEKLMYEKRVQECENVLASVETQVNQIKGRIGERERISEQAQIMREDVNPYLRTLDYKLKSVTPELHDMLLKLKESGLEHNLESLQKHCVNLENADYLRGFRNAGD